jgi:hypothetical protein
VGQQSVGFRFDCANVKTAGERKTLEDFNKLDITLGALEGSTAEEMAGISLPNARIKT